MAVRHPNYVFLMVRALKASGYSGPKIARALGISISSVSSILHGSHKLPCPAEGNIEDLANVAARTIDEARKSSVLAFADFLSAEAERIRKSVKPHEPST